MGIDNILVNVAFILVGVYGILLGNSLGLIQMLIMTPPSIVIILIAMCNITIDEPVYIPKEYCEVQI